MENENLNENVELHEEEVRDENGIKIADDVVAVIAGVAVSEVPGACHRKKGGAPAVHQPGERCIFLRTIVRRMEDMLVFSERLSILYSGGKSNERIRSRMGNL